MGGRALHPEPQVESTMSVCGTNPTPVKIPFVANELGGLGETPPLPTLPLGPFFFL